MEAARGEQTIGEYRLGGIKNSSSYHRWKSPPNANIVRIVAFSRMDHFNKCNLAVAYVRNNGPGQNNPSGLGTIEFRRDSLEPNELYMQYAQVITDDVFSPGERPGGEMRRFIKEVRRACESKALGTMRNITSSI